MALKLKRRQDLGHADAQLIGRGDDADELQIVSAAGSRVEDARGRTFIDLQMGWCVGNLGWNHPEIVARLRQFDGPSYVVPSALYAPWVELARLLADLTPRGLERSFRATGGTEAVEIAMQLAMKATKRHKFVSIEGAYHGASIAARSIGERDSVEHPLPGQKQLAPPLDAKALERLDTLLEHRDVAALIMEPIIMNLGVEVPDAAFMQGAAKLCKQYGSLLVMDEVACGFGRTGKLFASEHYRLEPDIMCLAKSITSGHAALGATIATEEVTARAELDYYSTFGWHPLSTEAAIATLEFMQRHEAELMANVAARSQQLCARLSAMPWKREISMRVKGLALAVELGDGAYAESLVERIRKAGVLVGAEGTKLVMFPALTIDADTASEAMDLIERAVAKHS